MGLHYPCIFSIESVSRSSTWALAWIWSIPNSGEEDETSACSVMPLQEGPHCLSWLLILAPVSGYSCQAKGKDKLQGQFSISFTHQLCRKPTEAIQVTSYRALVHPRSCFRSRQLKNSRQGKFPACHSYHSPRHVYGGLNAGKRCP